MLTRVRMHPNVLALPEIIALFAHPNGWQLGMKRGKRVRGLVNTKSITVIGACVKLVPF